MNKKMIFALVGVALAAFIGFGLYKANGLRSLQIVREVTIKGSQQDVFHMVKYLGNFPKWSPFLAQDPGQKYEVRGTDGTVGAQYHWNGNKGKDAGHQKKCRRCQLPGSWHFKPVCSRLCMLYHLGSPKPYVDTGRLVT